MLECNTCNEIIAEDARICPSCGANQYKKTTVISILIAIVQSFFITFFFAYIIKFINKDFFDKLNDITIFTGMGIIFILLIYKNYNTKKEG